MELRPARRNDFAVTADAGRAANSADIIQAPTSIAIFDLPVPGLSEPGVQIACASASPGWNPVGLTISAGGANISAISAGRQTVMGRSLSVLGFGTAHLFDLINSLDVQLIDSNDWLTSCDDADLCAGANLAALGDELFQFGSALPLGDGRFRLSRLLRGRRGTEWAIGFHAVGELFAILGSGSFRSVTLTNALQNTDVSVVPLGLADGEAASTTKLFTGEAARPPSPVALQAVIAADGALVVSWVRRSRRGWDWTDGMEVPLGENSEAYRIVLQGSVNTERFECTTTSFSIAAAQLASVGAGTATLSVMQVGDHALSRATAIQIQIA
jgi:hypothetical protein